MSVVLTLLRDVERKEDMYKSTKLEVHKAISAMTKMCPMKKHYFMTTYAFQHTITKHINKYDTLILCPAKKLYQAMKFLTTVDWYESDDFRNVQGVLTNRYETFMC